jgi:cryptochrome
MLHHRCGCLIGKDYPYPIVDHTTISKHNMGRMKAAYDAAKGPGADQGGRGAAAAAGGDEDSDGGEGVVLKAAKRGAKAAGKAVGGAAAKRQRSISEMLTSATALNGNAS